MQKKKQQQCSGLSATSIDEFVRIFNSSKLYICIIIFLFYSFFFQNNHYLIIITIAGCGFFFVVVFLFQQLLRKNWCNLRYVTQQNLFFIVSYLYVFLISIYFNLDHNLRLS